MLQKHQTDREEVIRLIIALRTILSQFEDQYIEHLSVRSQISLSHHPGTSTHQHHNRLIESLAEIQSQIRELCFKSFSPTTTPIGPYLELLKDFMMVLEDRLTNDSGQEAFHVDEVCQWILQSIRDLIALQCSQCMTIKANNKEYTLSGLQNNKKSFELYQALKKCVIEKMRHPQIDQSISEYKTVLDNRVYNNTHGLYNDLLVNVFHYLPVNDLASVSTVCERWRKASFNPALWRTRLHQDFGLAMDKCCLLRFPDKAYRRLKVLQGGRYFVMYNSNRAEDFPTKKDSIMGHLQIIYLIKDNSIDVIDYPEIFYPYNNVAEVNFQKKLQTAPVYKLRYWYEMACIHGNYEFIKHLSIINRSLLNPRLLLIGAVSGDMALTRYFSPGVEASVKKCRHYFDCAMKLGNYQAAQYFRKIWGDKVRSDDPCRISIQFVGAVMNGPANMITWLRNEIYPNFDITLMLCDEFKPLLQYQEFVLQAYPCYFLILRESCRRAPLRNIMIFVECFNIDIRNMPIEYFKLITNNLIGAYAIMDIDTVMYFCHQRASSDDKITEYLDWPDVNEAFAALCKLSKRNSLVPPNFSVANVDYFLAVFLIQIGNLEQLKDHMSSFPTNNIEIIPRLCSQAALMGNAQIVDYFLANYSFQDDSIIHTIFAGAAGFESLPLIRLAFKYYPQNENYRDFLYDILAFDNLRLAEYLFEELNIDIPADWNRKGILMCETMIEYISHRYAHQQAHREETLHQSGCRAF